MAVRLAQDVAVVPLLRLTVAPADEKSAYTHVPAELRSLHVEDISGASATECVDRIVDKLREPLPTPGSISADLPKLPPYFQPRPDMIAEPPGGSFGRVPSISTIRAASSSCTA